MTGKVINKDGELYLVTYTGSLPVSPTNLQDTLIKLEKRLLNENSVWVEFIVDTIAVGSDEFNVIDSDVAIIEKIYSIDFGTRKELVSDAHNRYKNKTYPLRGFTPGYSNCKCTICNNDFIGSDSSTECELCVMESLLEG
jgi:hypothetical protein